MEVLNAVKKMTGLSLGGAAALLGWASGGMSVSTAVAAGMFADANSTKVEDYLGSLDSFRIGVWQDSLNFLNRVEEARRKTQEHLSGIEASARKSAVSAMVANGVPAPLIDTFKAAGGKFAKVYDKNRKMAEEAGREAVKVAVDEFLEIISLGGWSVGRAAIVIALVGEAARHIAVAAAFMQQGIDGLVKDRDPLQYFEYNGEGRGRVWDECMRNLRAADDKLRGPFRAFPGAEEIYKDVHKIIIEQVHDTLHKLRSKVRDYRKFHREAVTQVNLNHIKDELRRLCGDALRDVGVSLLVSAVAQITKLPPSTVKAGMAAAGAGAE